jgi:fructokinase
MSAQAHLFPRVRQELRRSLNRYVEVDVIEAIDQYVVPAGLGVLAGPLGALTLAANALPGDMSRSR